MGDESSTGARTGLAGCPATGGALVPGTPSAAPPGRVCASCGSEIVLDPHGGVPTGPATAAPWPFVGRGVEMAALAHAVADHRCVGAVLTGRPGVGKTRLAREALARAERTGHVVEWVTGLAAATAIPLGAFAHLLPLDDRAEVSRLHLMRSVIEELRRRGGGRRLILAVDEAQLLDGPSAALVHELATTAGVFVLAVLRTGDPPPLPVVALSDEGLARMIEVGPLPHPAVEELLSAVLGGRLEPSSLEQLWEASEGNALVLREIVRAGLEAGVLAEHDGRWRWRGRVAAGDRLVGVVTNRLYRLGSSERETLEILALAEPLAVGVLERVADPAAVSTIERKGLVEVIQDGRRLTARLSHPLYSEVLREAIPALSTRAARRRLADTLEATGARRWDDLLRLAIWRLDGGGPATAELLADGARRALDLFDPELAERLARAAIEAGGGFGARHLLGVALFEQHRGQEAEELLGSLEAEAASEEERAAVATTRAKNLFYRLDRPERADQVLRAAEEVTQSPCRRADLAAMRADFLLWSGSTSDVLDAVTPPVTLPVTPPDAGSAENGWSVWRLGYAVPAWAYSGQLERAAAELDGAMDEHEDAIALLWSRWWTLWLSGRFGDAHALAEREHARAGEGQARRFPASWPMMLGHSLLLRGRPRSARNHLREAAGAGTDRWGFRHLCLALLAQAAAMCGDVAEARSALAGAEALHRSSLRAYEYALELGRAWVAAAGGEVPAARTSAMNAADVARSLGQFAFEAVALHHVGRLGGAADVADRLDDVASRVDGRLAPALAAHVRALAADDAAGLEEVARGFEAMGAGLWAAEAAVAAARSHHGHGRPAPAYVCHLLAHALAQGCEGASTPALALLGGELDPLTRREREVAELAGKGLPSHEIAALLVVSLRTVDNHLYRVYSKLGIRSRAQLADLQARVAPAPDAAPPARRNVKCRLPGK